MKFFNMKSIKNFLLDLLFPRFCISCGKEGEYVCQDCLCLIEILEYQYCPICQKRTMEGKTCKNCQRKTKLNGLFIAVAYKNPLVKKLISQFKYKPYLKELCPILCSLIITHFSFSSNNAFNILKQEILVPVPLHRKRFKIRGFNQAEEIAKHLSAKLNLAFYNDVLIKIKSTPAQVGLSSEQREKNIKGTFICQKADKIKGGKILLVDDVYTTGATMEECAKILKQAGAREVWGIAVARE